MKDEYTDSYSVHHKIMFLLPWYVNKTLHDPEMNAVENHLKVCLTCKREIAALKELSLAINQVDIANSVAKVAFSRLKTKIQHTGNTKAKMEPERHSFTPAREHKRFARILARKAVATRGGQDAHACADLTGYSEKNARSGKSKSQSYRKFSFTFVTLSKPLSVVLIILIMLIPGYFIADRLLKSNYRTLSSSESLSISNNEIRVVFLESTNKLQRNSVIQSINGEIVDGPDARGVYLIRLKQVSDAKHILETISSLRKNSSVIFAEPAYALLSSSRSRESSK